MSHEYNFVSFKSRLNVELITIDSWALTNGIDVVDFLWLDLQGAELLALRGAEKMLKKVSAIHAEVSNIPLYQNQVLYKELKSFLKKHGFSVAVEAIFRIGGNVLFVKCPNQKITVT